MPIEIGSPRAEASSHTRRRSRAKTPEQAGPAPLLFVARNGFDMEQVGALCSDPRVELFASRELSREWVGFADRVAAVLIAGTDPWDALVYATSAEVSVPIVVVMPADRKPEKKELIAAGAAGCLLLPIDRDDVDHLVHVIAKRTEARSVVNPVLRLLLDPVGLTARHKDRRIHLTHREFAMLHVLNEHFGKPVSAQYVFDYVSGGRPLEGANTVQAVATWAYELRRKLKTLGLEKNLVNVRKFGYALKVQEQKPKRGRGRPRKEQLNPGNEL